MSNPWNMHERLDFICDGKRDYILVFPPSIDRHYEVEAYRDEILRQREGLQPNEWVDAVLSVQCQLEYRKIGQILFPEVSVEWLVPHSRHSFFQGGIGELSGLERLLGYSVRRSDEDDSDPPIVITSGRVDLDCLVDLAMTQYGNLAFEFTKRYGVVDTLKLLKQTFERLRGEEAIKERQQQRDKELWQRAKGLGMFSQQQLEQAMIADGVDPNRLQAPSLSQEPQLEIPEEILKLWSEEEN